MSQLVFCMACGQAMFQKESICPHCGNTKPQQGNRESHSILTTLFLGLSISACNPESTVQEKEPEEKTPVVQKVDAEDLKSTLPQDSPSSDTVIAQKVEAASDTPTADSAEKKEKPVEKRYTIRVPEKPVSAKYGLPPTPPPSKTKGKAFLVNIEQKSCEQAKSVAKRGIAGIQYCYERTLKNHPKTEGNMGFDAVIEQGKVQLVRIEKNTTKNQSLASCFSKRIRRFKFPSDCNETISLRYRLKTKK